MCNQYGRTPLCPLGSSGRKGYCEPTREKGRKELEMAHHIMQGGGEGAKHEAESTTLSTILEE
jgi:hypothetical protein